MNILIDINSTSLPEETEIVKLIASELVRLGVAKVSFITVAGMETIDQSALVDLESHRVVSPLTIRQLPQ